MTFPPTARPTAARRVAALAATLAAALAALALPGCRDLLVEEPESFVTPDAFYRTAADADAAVLATYRLYSDINQWRNRTIGLESASDQGRVGPAETFADFRNTGNLNYDAATSVINGTWNTAYETITRANQVIARVPAAQFDSARRAAIVGEAKFMRAFAYFDLVRLWGDVPVVTSPDQDGRTVRRAPVDSVYRQIIADAEDAARTLPLRQEGANNGRATRGAALTLLADVYLTRREWQRAADYARQVMDLGVYAMFPNYLQAFLPANENGQEHIFSFQAEGPASPVGSGFVAVYFPREVGRGLGGGNGSLQPTQWHLNSYTPGDYRKDVSYRTNWQDVNGRVYNNLYPHVYKYRPSQVTQFAQGDVNTTVYRYPEVLLIAAEALNELGRTPEAVALVNQVRARARRGTGAESRAEPADLAPSVTQAALRDLIYLERNWEMAHENKRWFDVVRRGQDYFMAQIGADPETTSLQPTDILWPIPQRELDLNPNLIQNPGY